jgi:luciferase-like monooxygenase
MQRGTMSREVKGRVAPPPRLGPAAQRVADGVGKLPGVSVQAHWEIGSQTEVNGTDFYVGQEELGHIHLDGEAHVPIGRALADVLISAKLAQRFPWSRDFVVVDTDDAAHALWVFGLRRDQIDGVAASELRARIRDHRAS